MAGVLRIDGAVDTNLRELRIMHWVCIDVRACKTARPSMILTATVRRVRRRVWAHSEDLNRAAPSGTTVVPAN